MDRCYRNPFLKKAIVRIDFSSVLEIKVKSLSKKSSEEILKSFPIPEPQEVVIKNYEMLDTGPRETQNKQNHLFYHGLKREKTLCIAPEFAFLEYNVYGTFENLKNDYLILLCAIQNDYDYSIKRFGLRYINQIEIPGNDPLEWDRYIESKLIANIQFPKERKQISRCFSSIVEQFDDGMFLNFQYGIHNPDYPSQVKKSQFIIDNDAYFQGLMDIEHARDAIDLAHKRIEQNFEDAITDELRKVMGVVEDA